MDIEDVGTEYEQTTPPPPPVGEPPSIPNRHINVWDAIGQVFRIAFFTVILHPLFLACLANLHVNGEAFLPVTIAVDIIVCVLLLVYRLWFIALGQIFGITITIFVYLWLAHQM